MTKTVVAIGVFDGVHIGHQQLLQVAREEALARGVQLIALTFDPHPMTVVKSVKVQMLASLEQRIALLEAAGAPEVFVCDFNHARSEQSAEDFIAEILQGELNAECVVIGEGFRFGHKAKGDSSTLRNSGLEVREVPHTTFQGQRVSSTRIRECLTNGEIQQANLMLGRHFEICGEVVKGFQRGRELGYPTANVQIDDAMMLPKDGVYAGFLSTANARYPAAISVGYNETFNASYRTLEVYALEDTWLELYGQYVGVEFTHFIRGMEKFDGVEALLNAMESDILSVRRVLNLG